MTKLVEKIEEINALNNYDFFILSLKNIFKPINFMIDKAIDFEIKLLKFSTPFIILGLLMDFTIR